MTPQELKYSIICLALQGKLAEQYVDDKPVDISNIKQKQTEEYEFDLPEKWMIGHIETVTKIIPSRQYQILESEVLKEGKYAVISQSKEYSIGFSNDESKVFHHNEPVIVFGDHTTEIKYVNFDFVVGADGVKIFLPDSRIIFAKFFYYVMLFNSNGLNKVGGYSRHYKYIKDKAIPLPPLAEQKRIVAKIEELLPYIERYEKAWNKLEELNKRFPTDLQKSILQLAIQGKLVEQRPEEGTAEELYQQIQAEKQRLIKEGKIKKEKPLPEITEDEIPFDIPESWFWTKIESVTYTVGNRENQIQTKEILPEGDFPVVSQGQSLIDGYTNQREKVIHNLPLVMFGDHTRNVKYIDFPFVIGADGTKFHKCILVYPKFLYYWMIYASGQLRNRGYARHYVLLKQQLIPLPPLAEQKRIVAKIEELMPLCEKLKRD
jgi:restriction endonuclease S subunit